MERTEIDIATIADEDTLLGFRLAGVKHGDVFDPERVAESLERYKGAKLLIITEKVAEHLRANGLMERVGSVIAEIPDKGGSSGAALRNISRLLETAIGIKLKG